MRKFLSLFTAALLALSVNAAVINIDNTTEDALRLALNEAASGDIIEMAAGTYVESATDYLAFTGKEVTVRAAEGADVILKPTAPVRLKEGAKAEFINIRFDCSGVGSYDYVIVAADDTDNKRVVLNGCEFYGWAKNKAMIEATSSRRLASVAISNCYFHDCMKSVVFIENTGSIELSVINSTFANISTDTESFWAGVIDSRASAGSVLVDHCTFYNVLPMNTDYAAVGKVATPGAIVSNCIFMLPEAVDGVRAIRDVAQANNCLTFNYLKDSGTGIHSDVAKNNCIHLDPLFVDAANGNFTLGEGSPAIGAAADGSNLGDPFWAPAAAPDHTYTVAGSSDVAFVRTWDPAVEANDMSLVDGLYVWEKADLSLAAGTIEFKVCEDHAWDNCWPAQNYVLNIDESGIYTITITFNADSKEVAANALKTGEAVVLPTVAMHGNFLGSWADTENFAVAEDGESASLLLNLAEGNYEFGMRIGGAGNWTANGVAFTRENHFAEIVAGQGNLTLAADAAGDYIFTWTYASNTLAINFPEGGAPVEPTLENGFYLVGSINEWTPAAEYHLVGNPENTAEFMVSVTLAEGDELKVVNVLNDEITAWYPAEGGNYIVDAAHAGEKVVYFNPDYQEAWGGYIFIPANEEPIIEAWAEILFVEPVAKADLAENASFSILGSEFAATVTDTGDKMEIDANDCRFGTAEEYKMYSHRLKSGGKSSASTNFITFNIPADGVLRVAARTGSNSATDRNLVIMQGENELYNQVVVESDAIDVVEGENTVKVYPYVELSVAAGEVVLSYPIGGLNFYAFAFKADGGETPVEPETIPTTAPAVPAQEEANVMGIYCNHYATNNANFGISGWAGGYQTLDLDGTMAAYWTGMTWECIIDPVNTGAAHDFSAYENVHVDMWAPAAAKIKFTAEAVADYKDGQVLDLVQGWNSFDIAIADWAGNYDFANLKCFVLEQYQTPAGESFEGNPFAVANIYFWNAPVATDTYTVAGSSAVAFGTTWDPANAENDMELQEDGTYKWEKENLELAAGELAFKVCENHAWTHAWPAQDYKLAIPEAGVYTITITFNPAAESDHVAALATKTGEAVVLPNVILHGNFFGNWADTDPFVAAADKLTASLTLTLAEGNYEFGFKFDGAWKANGANITRDANATNLSAGDGNMHIAADKAGEYVFVYTFASQDLVVTYPAAGPEPLVKPTDAPVPTAAEDDVMAIFCNHYTTNNANFWISGWAGGYEVLDLDSINVGYWTGMTWECIIDPAHTDDPHDFSAYKNIHVDLWAPIPASIKFTAEAVTGGNYKDGQVVEMQQGWNSMDFVVAEWPGNYDFANLKCFVFENYTIEGQPFAFANIYFFGKEQQGIDNTAVETKVVKMIENGQLIILKNGVRYNAQGAIVR